MEVSQDSKDEYILTSIQNYFGGVGKVYQCLLITGQGRIMELLDKD